MSYARFGWDGSDVYVYHDVSGGLRCDLCPLQEREWVEEPGAMFGGYLRDVGDKIHATRLTAEQMVQHLDLHEAAGHGLPKGIRDEIMADRDEINEDGCPCNSFPEPTENAGSDV